MRRTLAAALIAVAVIILVAPVAAVADDPPVFTPIAESYATQDPAGYTPFVSRPCANRRSVDCYWEAISRTGQGGESYFVIRVGRQVCVRFWDRGYDRRHGHCVSVRRWDHRRR